ncbi:MAG: tail fiber domain-containing protein, partial [Patescibacteria group bacterium]
NANGTDVFVVKGNGNVGIGPTSMVTRDTSTKGSLQVGDVLIMQDVVGNQTSYGSNAYYDGTIGGWKRNTANYAASMRMVSGEIRFEVASSSTAGSILNAWDGTGAGGVVGKFDQSGNFTVYGSGTTCVIGSGTGATNCTSDQRLKANITAISGADALAGLEKIRGVTFNWADPTRPQDQRVGVIAQDVMQAFPQLVSTATTSFMGVDGQYYTVDYAALVSPLIAGVNELNTRVDSILNGTATSTITNVAYQNASTTNTDTLCIGGDCRTAWPATATTTDLSGYALLSDLSGFATTTPDVSNFITNSQLAAAISAIPTATSTDLSGYALLTDLSGFATTTPDVSNFITNSQLAAAISAISTATSTVNNYFSTTTLADLTGYALLSDLSPFISSSSLSSTLSNYALLSDIPSLTGYAKLSDIPAAVTLANLSGTVTGDIVPNADNTYDLGSPSHRLANVYATNINAGDLTFTETANPAGFPTHSFVPGDVVSLYVSSTAGSTHTIPMDLQTALNTGINGANSLYFNTSGGVGIGVASTSALTAELDVRKASTGDTRLLSLNNASATGNLSYQAYIGTGGDLTIASNDNSQGTRLAASNPVWGLTLAGYSDYFDIGHAVSGSGAFTNTSAFRITNAGRIGIGSTTPFAKFAINPVAGDTNQFVVGSSTATSFIITPGGTVGIGTASPSSSFKLDVNGALQAANLQLTASTTLQNFTFLNATGTSATTTNFFATTASSTNLFAQTAQLGGVAGLTVPAGGNVGIGTASPQKKLELDGGTNTDTYLRIGSGAQSSAFTYDIGREASTGYLKFYGGQTGANGFIFTGVDGERMRINTSGNLGIGTATIGDVLPSGFNSDSGNARILEVRSAAASAGDVGLFLARSDGTTTGLQIWHDFSQGDSYIDNRYNNDAGNIRFRTKTAGTPVDAMTILGSGNVGIGTASPSYTLDIASSTRIRSAAISSGQVGNSLFFSESTTNVAELATYNFDGTYYGLKFRAWNGSGLADIMSIKGNGNVGIGTTSPVSLLSLAGATSATFGMELTPTGWTTKHRLGVPYSGDTLVLGVNSKLTSATAGTLDDTSNAGAGLILSTNTLNYVQASAGSGSRTFSSRLLVDSSGNVGIGNVAPKTSLHVAGTTTTATIPAAGFAGNAQLALGDSSNAYGLLTGVLSTGSVYQQVQRWDGTATTYPLLLQPNGGNVGIGTTSATFGGQGAQMNMQFISNNGVGFGINDSTPQTGAAYLQFRNNVTLVGSISNAGSNTVAYNTTSDRRIKENIADTSAGLSTLLQIPVRDFDFITDPTHARTQGFVAQEVYSVYPYAVTANGDNGVDALGASSTPWMVDYGRLTPLLAQSIKDVNAKVDSILNGTATSTITNVAYQNASTTNTDTLCIGGDCRTAWPAVATTTDLSGYALLSDVSAIVASTTAGLASIATTTNLYFSTTTNISYATTTADLTPLENAVAALQTGQAGYAKLSDLPDLSSFVSTSSLAAALAGISSTTNVTNNITYSTTTMADLTGLATLSDLATATSSIYTALAALSTPDLSSYAKLSDIPAAVTLANLSGTVTGDIVPNADNTYDLGSPSHRLANVYATNINAGDLTFTETQNPAGFPAHTFVAGDVVSLFVSSTAGSTHTIPMDLQTALNTGINGANSLYFNTSGGVGIGVASTSALTAELDVRKASTGDTRLLSLNNASATGNLSYQAYIPTSGDLIIASNDNSQATRITNSRPVWNLTLAGLNDYFDISHAASGSGAFASTSALRITNSGLVGIGTTSPYSMLSVAGQVVGQNFVATSTTAVSSFQQFLATNATSTNFFATTASSTNLFAQSGTVGTLLTLGSTTLQNFTALQSTSTNATSTNFFATTASSTNLFAQSATIGGLNGLNVPAGGNVGIGTASPGSLLSIGAASTGFNVDSTGHVGIGAAPSTNTGFNLNGGTITASAATAQGIVVSGATTLAAAANNDVLSAIRVNPIFSDGAFTGVTHYSLYSPGTGVLYNAGNVGIGTTSPWGKLSITQTGTGGDPAFIVE